MPTPDTHGDTRTPKPESPPQRSPEHLGATSANRAELQAATETANATKKNTEELVEAGVLPHIQLAREVGIDQARLALTSGRPVTIRIDSTKGRNEAQELYDMMAERQGHLTLMKARYSAVAPAVTEPGGISLSTREQAIIAQKDIKLADGTTLKAGTVLPNGTVFDGTILRSADPEKPSIEIREQLLSTKNDPVKLLRDFELKDGTILKAGLELPHGLVYDGMTGLLRSTDPAAQEFQIGGITVQNRTEIPRDAIGGGETIGNHQIANGTRVEANSLPGGQTAGGPAATEPDHIIVRRTTGLDGKEILDTYPISTSTLNSRWKHLDGINYETKAVPTDSVIVPPNISIKSLTKHGPSDSDSGYAFRADGFGVSPKDLLETWNGYTNEQAYDFMLKRYNAAGLADSPAAAVLTEQRKEFLRQHAVAIGSAEVGSPSAADAVRETGEERANERRALLDPETLQSRTEKDPSLTAEQDAKVKDSRVNAHLPGLFEAARIELTKSPPAISSQALSDSGFTGQGKEFGVELKAAAQAQELFERQYGKFKSPEDAKVWAKEYLQYRKDNNWGPLPSAEKVGAAIDDAFYHRFVDRDGSLSMKELMHMESASIPRFARLYEENQPRNARAVYEAAKLGSMDMAAAAMWDSSLRQLEAKEHVATNSHVATKPASEALHRNDVVVQQVELTVGKGPANKPASQALHGNDVIVQPVEVTVGKGPVNKPASQALHGGDVIVQPVEVTVGKGAVNKPASEALHGNDVIVQPVEVTVGIEVPARGGEKFDDVAKRALVQARGSKSNSPVSFEFSGVALTARAGEEIEDSKKIEGLRNSYLEEVSRRYEAFRQSPRGIAVETERQKSLKEPLSADELKAGRENVMRAAEALRSAGPVATDQLRAPLESLQKVLQGETGTSARPQIAAWNQAIRELFGKGNLDVRNAEALTVLVDASPHSSQFSNARGVEHERPKSQPSSDQTDAVSADRGSLPEIGAQAKTLREAAARIPDYVYTGNQQFDPAWGHPQTDYPIRHDTKDTLNTSAQLLEDLMQGKQVDWLHLKDASARLESINPRYANYAELGRATAQTLKPFVDAAQRLELRDNPSRVVDDAFRQQRRSLHEEANLWEGWVPQGHVNEAKWHWNLNAEVNRLQEKFAGEAKSPDDFDRAAKAFLEDLGTVPDVYKAWPSTHSPEEAAKIYVASVLRDVAEKRNAVVMMQDMARHAYEEIGRKTPELSRDELAEWCEQYKTSKADAWTAEQRDRTFPQVVKQIASSRGLFNAMAMEHDAPEAASIFAELHPKASESANAAPPITAASTRTNSSSAMEPGASLRMQKLLATGDGMVLMVPMEVNLDHWRSIGLDPHDKDLTKANQFLEAKILAAREAKAKDSRYGQVENAWQTFQEKWNDAHGDSAPQTRKLLLAELQSQARKAAGGSQRARVDRAAIDGALKAGGTAVALLMLLDHFWSEKTE